jgi:hypothetical protein
MHLVKLAAIGNTNAGLIDFSLDFDRRRAGGAQRGAVLGQLQWGKG